MKADKLINAFRSKDGATIISVKNPRQKFLIHFLDTFNELLHEISNDYMVECFYLSPRSKKSDIYHYKTNLPFSVFLEYNK
jgi:hypothetical protein